MKINKDFVKEAGDLVVDSIRTKNLLNLDYYGLFPSTSGEVTVNEDFRSTIIDVSKMSYLYVSGNFSLLGDGILRIGKYDSYPKLGATGTRQSLGAEGTINVIGVNYLLLSFSRNTGVTWDQIVSSFMVEKGQSKTEYTPPQTLNPLTADQVGLSDITGVTATSLASLLKILCPSSWQPNKIATSQLYFSQRTDLNALTDQGIYYGVNNSSTTGWPANMNANGIVIIVGTSDPTYNVQLAFGFGADKLVIRRRSGSTTWTNWKYVSFS